jgi:hypothetical protein
MDLAIVSSQFTKRILYSMQNKGKTIFFYLVFSNKFKIKINISWNIWLWKLKITLSISLANFKYD